MSVPGSSPGWAPSFLDYIYTSFTNATAFSPTDTMPLTAWAKLNTYLALASDLKIEVTSDSQGISVNVRIAFDDDVREVLNHAVGRIKSANDRWITERDKRAAARVEAEKWWTDLRRDAWSTEGELDG